MTSESSNDGQFVIVEAVTGKSGGIEITEDTGNPACSTALTRKPHKKSKRGCDQCKLRKLKCDERRLYCARCLHKAATCVYSCDLMNSSCGMTKHRRINPAPPAPAFAPAPAPSVSVVTDSFTLQDLRLFHHFLIKATPYLPLGNQMIWAKDIPQLSHHSHYLMHSMLALGASHLRRSLKDDTLVKPALTYRVQAIKGLREAMQQENPVQVSHPDAMIAACYTLLFASAYMSDGFWDWVSFLRLTDNLTTNIRASTNRRTLFNLEPANHYEHVKIGLPHIPSIDARLLRDGIASLDKLSHILYDNQEIEFCNILHNVCNDHIDSPQTGYITFSSAFKFWYDLSEDVFRSLMVSKSVTVRLLCAHFVSMILMMLPMSVIENRDTLSYQTEAHLEGMLGWIETMCCGINEDEASFAQFPKSVVATIRDEFRDIELGTRPPVLRWKLAIDLAERLNRMQLETR